MSGRDIARKMQKDSVAEYLNPVQNRRDALARKGIKPKDHERENKLKLQEKNRELQEQRAQEEWERENPRRFKLKQFQDVPSRVSAEPKQPRSIDDPRGTGSQRGPSSSDRTNRRDVVDTAEYYSRDTARRGGGKENVTNLLGGGQRPVRSSGYGYREADEGRSDPPPSSKPTTAAKKGAFRSGGIARIPAGNEDRAKDLNPSYGKVPDYLVERKKLKEAEEELARIELERSAPDGCVLLSEEERLETLMQLEEDRREANSALNRLPIANKTQASEKRRRELEQEIQSIEDNIKAFSKEKVYIRVDE
ncbi:putative Calmodulin-binding [Blattamonas nauphoetae]|uniref:Calmodulin-binding n=1 Tax=Blattamonas nauphoetae TaxID=2049346 RepID=A0ABQ9XAN9_9EUKA|nr:putative Calmodulin-binding [Blattamonas nauphoetae]